METTIQKVNSSQTRSAGLNPASTDIQLPSNKLVALTKAAHGTRIVSVDGTLWVTQEGDEQDYLLKKGESVTLRKGGKVLIQGLTDSRARILPSQN